MGRVRDSVYAIYSNFIKHAHILTQYAWKVILFLFFAVLESEDDPLVFVVVQFMSTIHDIKRCPASFRKLRIVIQHKNISIFSDFNMKFFLRNWLDFGFLDCYDFIENCNSNQASQADFNPGKLWLKPS